MYNPVSSFKTQLLIIVMGALFFIPFLGGVHLFDWDEVNFAEVAREMIETNNFLQVQIYYQPFFEKPPLFFWLQAVSMKIFGINEFAARFPNAIAGIITLLFLFRTGSQLVSNRFGFIWTLAYFGSILPHFYFRSGIIDPVFNLLIFIGIYNFIKYKWKVEGETKFTLKRPGSYYLISGGVFIGLAILTKGPVAYLILLLTVLVYWATVRFRLFVSIPKFILYSLFAALVMLIWFGIEYATNGPEFIREFIVYQIRLLSTEDAGHGGFPGYHFVVVLLGCFPVSIFAIRAFFPMKIERDYLMDFRKWMLILTWVILILFSLVQSKIVHYSSLVYFPVTFLGALTISELIDEKIRITKWMKGGVIAIGTLIALIIFVFPFLGNNIHLIKPLFSKDIHGQATLDADVNWTGLEILPGVILILGIVLFILLVNRKSVLKGFQVLFFSVALFLFSGLIFFIGRIEAYSQNSYVEFCKSIEGKPGYVISSGFKSYVHLFYTKRQPSDKPIIDKEQMINGEVDRDVYIFGKKTVEKFWDEKKNYEKLGSKNGYVFYKRIRE